MVVRLVARVELETMESKLIYPRDESRDERVALLTGITQLVSAALNRTGATTSKGQPMFMKSDHGVIGYLATDDVLFICEGDGEREVGDVLKTIWSQPTASDEKLASEVDNALRKRGREIGDLWR